MNILICTQNLSKDQYVIEVSEIIKARGYTPVYFERYRNDHFITYSYSRNTFSASLMIEGKTYDLAKSPFYSIWWRVKPVIKSEIPGAEGSIREKFCMLEWRQALNAFECALAKTKWVNPLSASLLINNKPMQLKLASQHGLLTPHTVITNNVDEVLSLLKREKRIIYKTLSSFFNETEAVFTTEITQEMILKDPNAIRMAPGIFQNLIEKAHELRVMVIANQVFVVKVNSQVFSNTQLDWRREPNEEMFSVGELTKDTRQKLLAFHQASGLIYAAYDFIVDKKGREIFLECNPNGQWVLGKNYSISEFFAKELIC